MATNIPLEIYSHTRKICNLYKRYLRHVGDFEHHTHIYRYNCALVRQKFQVIYDEKDMMKAKAMMAEKEEELWRDAHWQPRKFQDSPGGVAYQREVIPPDWVMDYWHPLEKAQYPDYFARRELRKQQYIEMWDKKYGPPPKDDHAH